MRGEDVVAVLQLAAQYSRLYHEAVAAWWALLCLGAACLAAGAALDARDRAGAAVRLVALTGTGEPEPDPARFRKAS